MKEDRQERLGQYIELLEEIKERTGDEVIALRLLTEISKDRRMDMIRQEREKSNGDSATAKQKEFMKRLNIKCPKTVTKQEASIMIDEELGKEVDE